ncbi:hypothetical protein PLA106_00985 [Pseudomonas amygdali pv. lachrymans str. M302278]|nr:hypothetical protein PLA106_00985 [Pseudomonas amygdali pv. lachrymans str. M302278]
MAQQLGAFQAKTLRAIGADLFNAKRITCDAEQDAMRLNRARDPDRLTCTFSKRCFKRCIGIRVQCVLDHMHQLHLIFHPETAGRCSCHTMHLSCSTRNLERFSSATAKLRAASGPD